jgi:hypothetical protein
MSNVASAGSRVGLLVASLFALEGPAAAQQDFASCDPDMPVCTGDINDCCYRPMNPVGSNRAVIIPLDRCHQRIASSGADGPPAATSPAWCADSPSGADEGQFQAYGLVYRLMQNGIPVHWAINPTKDPPSLTAAENASSQTYTDRDIDFWVLGPEASAPLAVGGTLTSCIGTCIDPVKKLVVSSATATANSYNYKQFPVRGSAFIIAPEDRTRFNNFIKRSGEFAAYASNSRYDFSAVDMYEITAESKIVYSDYRSAGPNYTMFNGGADSAPISTRIDYSAPKLARMSPAGVSAVWLTSAKLDAPASSTCKTGLWTPSDAVYCDVTVSDIGSGVLVNGGMSWAWLDNWSDNSPCGNATETAQVDAVRTFMTAVPGVRNGGSVMFMDAVISVFESPECGSRQPAGKLGTGVVAANQTPGEPFIMRKPASQFMQWGDLPTEFASGSIGKWFYYNGTSALGYESSHTGSTGTLVRLLTEDRAATGNTLCTHHKSTAACDVFANSANADNVDAALYMRYLDQPANGIVFYQGGNNVNGRDSHLRLILNSLIAMPGGSPGLTVTMTEKSRSAPIVATIGDETVHMQGTFEVPSSPVRPSTFSGAVNASTFNFPGSKGHLRAVRASTLTSTATSFANLTALYDAGADSAIPTATASGCTSNFTGNCRTVFTTTTSATNGLVQRPGLVYMKTGNVSQLKPLMGSYLSDADAQTLISRVVAGIPNGSGGWKGKLGGIDRSTPAIIEPSPMIADYSERPTMIYVGAMDGMLHAICAEAKGVCPAAGRELWAFIPRTQLPFLRLNTARIDGAPKVADVFDDFTPTDGESNREWRTVLTVQTGNGNPGDPARAPAAIALDITNPASPAVLWERTTRAIRGTGEQGAGLGIAMGNARVAGQTTGVTYLQTNNGGTGGAGFWLGAVVTSTGALAWESTRIYPAPRSSANPPVPASGIPGGVAAIGIDESGLVTRIVAPSLYGGLWLYDAGTGNNPLGSSALVQITTDHHPVGAVPTVYQSATTGRLYAVAVTGGYVDPIGSSWSPTGQTQYMVSAAIEASAGNAPITEAGSGNDDRAFVQDLGSNNRGIAQAVVAGDEIFVLTDTSDVNNAATYGATATGSVRRFRLTNGTQIGVAVTVAGGASSVDVTSAGDIHVGSGTGAQKVAAFATGGGVFNSTGRLIERDEVADMRRALWISG